MDYIICFVLGYFSGVASLILVVLVTLMFGNRKHDPPTKEEWKNL